MTMSNRTPPPLLLMLFAILTVVAGCCTDPVNGSRYFCLGEVSDAEEAELGKQYAPAFIAESGGEYPDPELQRHLGNIVVEKMARHSHRPNLPWRFTILNTSQINAFALPGGQVFVTRGLISMLETEAQFAHLMGHEIGHVSHRHSIRGQSRGALLNILVGAVAVVEDSVGDPDEPHLISGTAGALGQLAFLKFSRDQELESDERGVDYALEAGYDPREGKRTFEMFLRLKQEAGQGENLLTGLLSTHPLDSDRISAIDSYIAETYPNLPENLVATTPEFGQQLASVKKAQSTYEKHDRALQLVSEAQESKDQSSLDEAEALLREGERDLSDHAPFPIALGVIDLLRDDSTSAERNLSRACELDPDNYEAHLYRGMVYQRTSRPDDAIRDFERANSLNPLSALPTYYLGNVHEERGDSEKARQWYEKSIELAPRGTEVRKKSRQRLQGLTTGELSA